MHLYPQSLQDLSPTSFLANTSVSARHSTSWLSSPSASPASTQTQGTKAVKGIEIGIALNPNATLQMMQKNSTDLSTAKGQGSKMLAARPQGFPWNLLRLGHAEPLRKLVTVAHLLSPPWTEAGPITIPIEAGLGVNELGSTLGWLKMPNLCLIVVSDLSTQVMSSSKIWWSTHLHKSLPTQVAAEGTSMITVFGSAIILRKRVATR